MEILIFVIGLCSLVLGAELLVRGSSRLGLAFGISPLVVGLTIVAFGTSAPELAVSVGSALRGAPDFAIGNVLGSNIFNVLFILGVSALITPLLVNSQVVRQEVPIMIGASALFIVFALDGILGRFEAGVLLLLLVAYTIFLVWQSRREGKAIVDEFAQAVPHKPQPGSWSVQLLLVVIGFGMLVMGANWLVDSSTAFARALGVSDVVIGLTVVAAGTSLPEVATSITAALRGQRDIAIGNVVGSNTFNLLGCLGATGLVADGGLPIDAGVMNFDIWVMLAVAVACIPVLLTGRVIARWEGGLFAFYYVAYTSYLVLVATENPALPSVRTAMLSFVLPLTVVTLVVSMIRAPKLEL